MALHTTVVYKEINDCAIQADVYLPTVESPPVVLYFHGGALISGSRKYLPAYQTERLNEAGMAVVSFDYRLAPETRLEEIVEDVKDAVRWARAEGAARFGWDGTRMAVMGSSAGGYLSLLAGTFVERPRAIVAFYGYGDILGDWYTIPSAYYCQRHLITKEEAQSVVGSQELSEGGNARYTFYFYCRQQGSWPQAVSGYHPLHEREKLTPFCPVHNIHKDYPPTLLLHGDADTDVPYEQSVQMAEALARAGIESELITVKGAGHGFDGDGKDPQARQIFERVVSFLQDHLNDGN